MSKTHYTSLSTETSQWFYTLDSIKKYQNTFQNDIRYHHQKYKKKRTIALDTIHRDHLKCKLTHQNFYDSTKRIFITRTEPLVASSEDIVKRHERINSLVINIEKPFFHSFYPSISDAINYNSDSTKVRESPAKFLKKTKAMVKTRQIKEFQLEKLREINEVKTLQFQEIEFKTRKLTKCSQMMLYFNKVQHQYVKYLNAKLEEEKKVNVSLFETRSALECALKQINNKMNIVNKLIQNNKQYKLFLVLIKYKVKSVDQLPCDALKKYGIAQALERESFFNKNSYIINKRKNSMIAPRGSFSCTSPLLNIATITNHRQTRRFSRKSKNQITFQLKEVEPPIFNPPIFSSPEEFIEHLKEIENSTAQLFVRFNDITYSSQTLYKERSDSKRIAENSELEDQRYFDSLIEEVYKEKRKHKALLKEYSTKKEILDKCPSAEVLFKKIKKRLLTLPFDIEKKFEFPSFYNLMNEKTSFIYILGKRESKAVYSIKVLEKILLFYISTITAYKNNIRTSNDLRKVMFLYDKKKRYEKSLLNQSLERQRREQMNNEIIKKYNKVLFIPKKKIDKKYILKPKTKIEKDTSKDSEEDFNLEKLLTY